MGISVNHLKFSYGKHPVLKGIEFQLQEGIWSVCWGKTAQAKVRCFGACLDC